MMKRYNVNILNKSSVVALAEMLKSAGEDISICFEDVICCPHYVVPAFALIDYYRSLGRRIDVFFPEHSTIESCFKNRSLERPFGSVWRFDNQDVLLELFDATQKAIMKLPNVGKGFKTAFGWCLSEVMDNVLQHSQEKSGLSSVGYLMIQYVHDERLLKCCVFDLGIGLYESFLGTKYNPQTPADAVGLAVMPNVTSGNGQGNGLYGLKEIVKQSDNGRLEIRSAGAKYLLENGEERVEIAWRVPGFSGTTSVDFQIYFENEFSIDTVFPDRATGVDLWMENHEVADNVVRLSVLEIVKGTVSRDFGREMRNVVENIIENEHKRVIIDFAGVEMCSSAFVDELIGKLLEKYQFVKFMNLIDLVGVSGLNALLIDHSIRQRLGVGHGEERMVQ